MIRAKTESGIVEGVRGSFPFHTVFRGVPYMAPPVSGLRWKSPQPVKPWDGIRICDRFKPIAMQPPFGVGNDLISQEFMSAPVEMSEDCMYLNIWTPAENPEEKLPVMVYIHGGGWQTGYSYLNAYDGESFCKRGIIMVTIPWRVGAFGFLCHPELTAEGGNGSSGNYGYQDQVFALKWIKRNISAFGGDPDNITVFGQSAGAGSIRGLCATPLARGLFNRAIIQSIGMIYRRPVSAWTRNLETQEKLGMAFFDYCGFRSLEEARACSGEELLEKVIAFGKAELFPEDKETDWYAGGYMRFGPTEEDGYYFPESPRNAVLRGHIPNCPYMIGSTAGDLPFITPDTVAFGENQARLGVPGPYMYYFSHVPPAAESAHHSVEHHYVFQTLIRSRRPYTGYDFDLSNELADRWAAFARTGTPNCPEKGYDEWTPYTPDAPKALVIGDQGCHMEIHPERESRRREWEANLQETI